MGRSKEKIRDGNEGGKKGGRADNEGWERKMMMVEVTVEGKM